MSSPADDSIEQRPFALHPRPITDWCDMAVVTQANLVTLRVRQCRVAGVDGGEHEIHTPAPGAVKRFREHLLDRHAIAAMCENDVGLRLRQVWGQFSGFCWLFGHDDPNKPPDFAKIDHARARCSTELAIKVEQVRQTLWRVRFEQQLRFVDDFRLRPDFHDLKRAAGTIEVDVYGRRVHVATPEMLILYGCEIAGVMSALRWSMDSRWSWGHEDISNVGLE